MTDSGFSNLMATTGESIRVDFDTVYYSATPGSSAWSVNAINLRISLTLPDNLPAPDSYMVQLRSMIVYPYTYVAQFVQLRRVGNLFVGEPILAIYIAGGSDGQTQYYQQYLQFDRLFSFINQNNPDLFRPNSLIDPINKTPSFQVSMFAASPWASQLD